MYTGCVYIPGWVCILGVMYTWVCVTMYTWVGVCIPGCVCITGWVCIPGWVCMLGGGCMPGWVCILDVYVYLGVYVYLLSWHCAVYIPCTIGSVWYCSGNSCETNSRLVLLSLLLLSVIWFQESAKKNDIQEVTMTHSTSSPTSVCCWFPRQLHPCLPTRCQAFSVASIYQQIVERTTKVFM